MPTLLLTAQGKVTGLWGHAIVKGADGHAHPLKLGDIVQRGDVILTSQDGIVELTSDGSATPFVAGTATDSMTSAVPAESTPAAPAASASRGEIDQVIEKLAQGDVDAATAAGLAGGEGGEFLPGLRVERIAESLTSLGFNNNEDTAPARAEVIADANPLAAVGANIAPSAVDGAVSGPENTTLPVVLRGIDSDGNVVSVTITSVPSGGTLLLADGSTVVSAGQTLTPAQAAGLLFQPAVDFVGQAAVTFFVTDNQGATSNAGTVSLNLVDTNPPPPNQPPVAVNDSATTPEDTAATGNVLSNDSDPEGSTLTVTQFSLGGVSYGAGATAFVAGVGSLTLAANGAYTFTPAANYNGPVPVATYTVSDGAASVTATLTLSVSPVTDAPVATPDSVPAIEDQPVIFDPRSNDSNVDGTPLSITAIGGQPIAIGTPVVLPQGKVSLNADGTLTFTPNPNVNGPVVFDYTVSNGGATSTSQVTVNIAPVNDAPVAVDDLASTPVNTATTITVLANDSDVDGNPLSVTTASVDPAFGTVTVNPNGTLAFNPANNVSGPVLIQYTISDGQGGVASATVTVNVGPNTPPEGADATVTLAEDSSRSFSAADFGFSDADAGQSFANVRIDVLPTAGSLTLSGVAVAAGQVIAVADLGNLVFTPAPNANGAGYASFNFSVQDSAGAFDAAPNQITIDVSAVNDAPVAVDDLASTPINTATTIAVLANDSDVDGNPLSVIAASVDPAFGTVTVNPNGTLAFNPANNVSGPVVISYTISDGQGGIASATATVNVGPNTPPEGSDANVVIAEDSSRSFSAADFGFSDADAGQSFANVRIDALPGAGSLTLSGVAVAAGQVISVADLGNLMFTPAPNGNGTGYASFSFSVQDSGGTFDTAPNQITIDVTAVADTAVIGGTATGATVEDTTLTTSGTLTVTDPDAGEAAFNPLTNLAGAHGSFNIDAAGVWTYTLNNADLAVQALGAGQTLPNETFTVTTIDGTSQVVTVTITGTNDVPVAQGASVAVTEDAPPVTGNVVATDIDANAALAYSLNAAPPAGLTFNPNGSYSFDASNPAYQSLAAGQQQVLTVPYTVTDDQGATSTANLVITITGTNDAAVIGGIATGSVTEDGVPVASGTLTVTDVDGPANFVASTATGTYGNFTVDAAGAWSYTLRNADANVQALTSAQHPIESFTVTSADGTTSTVTVTVNGANEAPVAIVTPASGNEDAAGIPVLLGGTDVDGSIASFTIGSLPTNGVLTFGGNPVLVGQVIPATAGSAALSFVPAANFNGSTAFDFTATDNEGAVSPAVNVPISVAAVADPAVIGGTATGATVEDTTLTTSGTLTVTDPDAGEAAFNPLTNVAGAHGSFNIDAAGVWTYTLNNADLAVQALGAGQTLPNETFTVTTIDGTSRVVTVTITGTNDVPVAQGASVAVTEDAPLVTGNVVATDIDANAVLAYSLNAAPPAGLTFNPNGSYSFDASNAAYQSLAAGQQQVLTIPYTVTDDQGATSTANLVITITGTNDAAVISAGTGSVTEDSNVSAGNLTTGGTLTVTDADAGQATFQAQTATAGAYGSFTLAANGAWTYTAANNNPAIQALGAGQTLTETFTVRSADGSTSSVVVTINGTNDIALISAGTGSVTEDTAVNGAGNITTGGTLTVTDADAGQSSFQAQASTAGAYGSFTLGANGVWTYAAANNNPAIQALGVGQTLTETFQVRSADGTTSSVVVTINGTNDVAVISAGTGSVTEDSNVSAGNLTTGGTLTVTDVDAGQATFQTQTSTPGVYGSFTLGANGAWTYAAANSNPAIQALGAGQTLTDTFTVRSADGTTSSVVVTINGTNDIAVISAGTGSVTEDSNVSAGNLTTGGTLTVTDADAGQATFQAQAATAGAYGSFTLGTNGAWTYTAANNNPAIQSLGAGQTLTETFTVRSADGTTSSVVVTINGTNDAPVARSDEGTVTAAQTLIVAATEGVIQSTSLVAGRDTDVDGDALTVTKVSAGVGAATTAVPNGGVTIAGTYGDLLLRNDGSYNYTASRADAVATGTQVNDVFSYQVSDGHGGFATATLTLHVGGIADTLNAAPPTTTALTATLGLNGEYYGYNDFNPGPTSPNRRHADDGVYGNLDRAADVSSIVNGRNAAFGGAAVAGSSAAADANAADARFLVRAIDYGTSPTVSGTLGTNPNIAAGGSIASLNDTNSQLYKFLNHTGGGDAGTITVGQGTGDNDQIGGGPTSGLGRTSDAAMRLSGEAYMAAGLYDIRVYADDGFRLKLDNQTVAAFDDIQSPTTRVYTGVAIHGGLTPLELLYWEQGGNAVLRVEFKLSGTADSAYQVLGSQNLPLFSDANAPVLSDLQDLVAGPTAGSYLVRTGSMLDGGNGDDILNGSAGRDILIGGHGKDTLNGGAGDDLIRGGAGDDQLTGGAGHDVFRWSLGDAGTAGTPARDVISDFDNTPHGGDVLDLRDLLVGESHAANTVALPASIGLTNALTITPHEGNLANYLHFSAVGGNTVVEISSTGGFSSSYTPAAVDQVITLTGLNLVGSFSNDHQVINDLLQRGKLVTD